VVLLIASVTVWLLPFHVMGRQSGVPVRDYIAQSTEFLICIFGLVAFAFDSQREGRSRHAFVAALLALLFLANILLVSTGRTALAVIPLLLLMLGFRLFGRKGLTLACVAGVMIAALAWTVSPFLRERINRSIVEVQLYQTTNESTSTGIRFELWKKAFSFVAAAPAIGHGTGSIPDQYRRAASGEGVTAIAANNPHNQILAVAIQLGMLGVALLMTMWVGASRAVPRSWTDFLVRPRDRDAEHRLVLVQFASVRLVSRLALRVRPRRARRHGVARGRACAAHQNRGAMTKPPARILVVAPAAARRRPVRDTADPKPEARLAGRSAIDALVSPAPRASLRAIPIFIPSS
jgi:hypothetical protein